MAEATDDPGSAATTGEIAQPGWYAAQGDPPGTMRYWNGNEWVGTPVQGPPGPSEPSPATPLEEGAPRRVAPPGTHVNVRAAETYASWGRRVAGWFIDLAVMVPFLVGAAVTFIAAESADAANPEDLDSPLWVLGLLLFLAAFVVSFVNSIIVHGVTGKTVGKRVMGTKLVLGDTDNPAGILRVVGRGLLSVVATNLTFGLYALIDFAFPLWDARKQRVSDKVVNTFVINAK